MKRNKRKNENLNDVNALVDIVNYHRERQQYREAMLIEVSMMRFLQGLTLKQISIKLGISATSAYQFSLKGERLVNMFFRRTKTTDYMISKDISSYIRDCALSIANS